MEIGPMSKDEFTPDVFAIDKYKLDEELVKQPRLYGEYALKLADAREEYERAKARRDVIEAELDQDVRNNPSEYGIAKVTEGAVEKMVTAHKRMIAATEKMITLKHQVDILFAMVTALEHRKTALEQLCYLHGRDYFAKPLMPAPSKLKREKRGGDG